jgi:hypothetical protein
MSTSAERNQQVKPCAAFRHSTGYRRGRWTAARRDNGRVLAADEPERLLVLIRQDYARQPVPRDLT